MRLDPNFATIMVGALSLVGGLGGALLAFRASSQANKISNKKIDAEAYERSQSFYEKSLAQAEKDIERVRAQAEKDIERVRAQAERDIERLRTQVDRLQDQLTRVTAQLGQMSMSSTAQDPLVQQMLVELRQQLSNVEGTIASIREEIPLEPRT